MRDSGEVEKRIRGRRNSERGQAQIEAVLTLPLMIFMVLGTIQLFMVLQARILAQYAAYSAARVGALSKGDCTAMSQAASLMLLPTPALKGKWARALPGYARASTSSVTAWD